MIRRHEVAFSSLLLYSRVQNLLDGKVYIDMRVYVKIIQRVVCNK